MLGTNPGCLKASLVCSLTLSTQIVTESVAHLRNVEGGCFGGLKRKVLVLNAPDRQKRPKNGPYQGYEDRAGGRHRTSSSPPYSSSRPKAQLHLVPKSPFNPFVRSGAHDFELDESEGFILLGRER